jgi:NAD(P)-dependent dehydrogenase (short-subunit alcohol dehydrogenase family)
MTGKVAVVTGATGGIGKEIARGLVQLGARVVIGARNAERGEGVRRELGGDVSVLPLDIADQPSVRGFADALGEQGGRLDVLVNNAGAWFTDRRQSPQGYELTFATNTLGPYLLTELLLDRLRAAGQARVVNIVSSIAGHYDAADLQFTRRPYDGYHAYAQSKQALRMLTWGLATRLEGSGVTANVAAPGFVRSELNRNVHGLRPAMINLSLRFFGTTPAKGADTPLWVAVAPELADVTGRYFEGRAEQDGKFHDPEPIADLERRCSELVTAPPGSRRAESSGAAGSAP